MVINMNITQKSREGVSFIGEIVSAKWVSGQESGKLVLELKPQNEEGTKQVIYDRNSFTEKEWARLLKVLSKRLGSSIGPDLVESKIIGGIFRWELKDIKTGDTDLETGEPLYTRILIPVKRMESKSERYIRGGTDLETGEPFYVEVRR
jgi:hypothetical protein